MRGGGGGRELGAGRQREHWRSNREILGAGRLGTGRQVQVGGAGYIQMGTERLDWVYRQTGTGRLDWVPADGYRKAGLGTGRLSADRLGTGRPKAGGRGRGTSSLGVDSGRGIEAWGGSRGRGFEADGRGDGAHWGRRVRDRRGV